MHNNKKFVLWANFIASAKDPAKEACEIAPLLAIIWTSLEKEFYSLAISFLGYRRSPEFCIEVIRAIQAKEMKHFFASAEALRIREETEPLPSQLCQKQIG